MSTDWIKYKRKNWPERSKERALLTNYPGCKTIAEALEVEKLRLKIKEANKDEKK